MSCCMCLISDHLVNEHQSCFGHDRMIARGGGVVKRRAEDEDCSTTSLFHFCIPSVSNRGGARDPIPRADV